MTSFLIIFFLSSFLLLYSLYGSSRTIAANTFVLVGEIFSPRFTISNAFFPVCYVHLVHIFYNLVIPSHLRPASLALSNCCLYPFCVFSSYCISILFNFLTFYTVFNPYGTLVFALNSLLNFIF